MIKDKTNNKHERYLHYCKKKSQKINFKPLKENEDFSRMNCKKVKQVVENSEKGQAIPHKIGKTTI